MRTKFGNVVLLVAFVATVAGLASCRKTETTITPTPAAQSTPQRVIAPAVSEGTSPLPTPGTNASPLPTPGTNSSPLQP